MPNLKSSKPHRDAQRANGIAEVATNAFKTLSPIAAVPGKLAQSLNSGYAFFHTPKVHEKGIHVFQFALALTQVAIAATLFFRSDDCKDGSESLCKASLVLELLYQGSLMAAWVPSELAKEAHSNSNSDSGSPSPEASTSLIT